MTIVNPSVENQRLRDPYDKEQFKEQIDIAEL